MPVKCYAVKCQWSPITVLTHSETFVDPLSCGKLPAFNFINLKFLLLNIVWNPLVYTLSMIPEIWHQLVKYKEAFCLVLNRNKYPFTNWRYKLGIINKVYNVLIPLPSRRLTDSGINWLMHYDTGNSDVNPLSEW